VAGVGDAAWWGAIAGFLAPVAIAAFIYVGGQNRPGYDAWQCTITELGDGADAVATWFLIVNVGVGFLLGWFAIATHEVLHLSRWVTGFIIATGVGSVVVGLTACRRGCCIPGVRGQARRWVHTVHLVAVGVILLCMVLVPWVTWRHRQSESSLQLLRWWSLPVAILVGLLGVLTISSRRQQDAGNGAAWITPGRWERLAWVAGYSWLVVAAGTVFWGSRAWIPGSVSVVVTFIGIWWPSGHRGDQPFDPADCQAGVLRPLSGIAAGSMLVGRIKSPARFRDELEEALQQEKPLLSGWTSDAPRDHFVTLGLSRRGLGVLGVNYRWRSRFVEDAFEQGMSERANVLGDIGESAHDCWDEKWREPERIHVAFWVQAVSPNIRTEVVDKVKAQFRSVDHYFEERTERTDRSTQSKEHFGFADGIGQPWVSRVPLPKTPKKKQEHSLIEAMKHGGGKISPTGRQKEIELGEFILGQLDETGDIFPVPDPGDLFRGGTYMVVRKLEQDVRAFSGYSAKLSGRAGPSGSAAGPEDLRERRGRVEVRLVGRHREGTPLESPDPVAPGRNSFRYGYDQRGLLCPLGAHVRRANPRDALGMRGVMANRRRIIRRGMPYGQRYDDAPDETRGLLFVCFNARIAEQFEFIQRQWLNDGRPFGLGTNPDPVVGAWPQDEKRAVLLQQESHPIVGPTPSKAIVRTRGGEYFFVPSLPGLRWLL
jgi:Dyp-type peroxidase family